jgi:hypothetical protein
VISVEVRRQRCKGTAYDQALDGVIVLSEISASPRASLRCTREIDQMAIRMTETRSGERPGSNTQHWLVGAS